jgi:predicted membrane channel-forming protein YqfA (hemolysin III family)
MIHNETVNVWSHLIGVLVFIGLIVYTVLWRGHPGQGSQMEVMRQRLMDAEMVRGLMHQGYTFD